MGQLGGRRGDPRRGHRPVHRPGQAALHRLRGSILPRQGPVDHAAPAAGPAARDRARPTRRSPYQLAGPRRRRRLRHPDTTPADGTRRIVAEIRSEQGPPDARRTRARLRRPRSSSSTTIRSGRRPRRGAPRRRRRRRRSPATRASSPAHRPQLADLLAGVARGRARRVPAAPGRRSPHDLPRDHPRPGARTAAPRRASARAYEAGTLRGLRDCLGLADRSRRPLRRRPLSRTAPMTKPLKQIHLAAHFPGVNNTTVWSDPAAGSHIEFNSFAHFAQTAERGKFDFLFLAEGLRLREQGGQIYDLDVVGRPDTFTVLAALAAVTDRLGLTGTINSTFNEPYEVARQFATPRPPLRRPGRVERRHLLGRVHRRELPPRRLPGPGGALLAGPGVPADRRGAVRLLARRRDRRRQGDRRRSCADAGRRRASRHHDRALRHRRASSTSRAARRAAR